MAALTVQNVLLAGALKSALVAAASGGDTFVNEGKTFLEVNNGDVSGITVTITGQQNLPLSTSATKTISVGATTTAVIGPFPVGNYNVESTEAVSVTYSAVVSVTVGAFSVNDDYN